MEKRRTVKLVSLLIQYAFCFLFAVFVSVLVWAVVFNIALNKGFVLPANAAEMEAKESIIKLEENGKFDKALISSLCEYALFSNSGEVIETSLKEDSLKYAKEYFLYGVNGGNRYHLRVNLAKDTCVLQYGFRINYTIDVLNQKLPDFQLVCLIGIFLCIVALFLVLTIYYAKKIKKHLVPLMLSVEQLANGDLENAFETSKIKEFDEVLMSMDKLRIALKDSMIEKWKMEQDRKMQTAALVHDIKTPLTVISGNAELLAESARTDEQIICSNVIIKNVHQTESYVEKLRQLSQSEQFISYKKEFVNGNALIREIKKNAQEICKVRKVGLIFQANEVGAIYVDYESIKRCVMNIIENACRFTKEEEDITITISESYPNLKIMVEDFGPGFSKEALKHATDLFYTENENRNPMGHSGIGLSYVKKIAALHGGKLTLSNSEDGHGIVELEIKVKENE